MNPFNQPNTKRKQDDDISEIKESLLYDIAIGSMKVHLLSALFFSFLIFGLILAIDFMEGIVSNLLRELVIFECVFLVFGWLFFSFHTPKENHYKAISYFWLFQIISICMILHHIIWIDCGNKRNWLWITSVSCGIVYPFFVYNVMHSYFVIKETPEELLKQKLRITFFDQETLGCIIPIFIYKLYFLWVHFSLLTNKENPIQICFDTFEHPF